MKLSTAEMICLNSLLDGTAIPCVELYAPIMPSKAYIEETISSMYKNGLSDKQNHLTEDGKLLLQALYKYKHADTYLILNTLSIGFGQDRLCVYIRKDQTNYHMFFQDRAEIYWELLQKYTWFMKADSGHEDKNSVKEYPDGKEQKEDIRSRWKEEETRVYLTKQVKGYIQEQLCIGKAERSCGCHDLLKQEYYEMSYRDARLRLWNLMELPKEEMEYGK